jgi:TetR/AcrR family transcriptional regulator
MQTWKIESNRSLSQGAFMKKTFLKLPDKKRLFILNAAAEIFAREGYHHASISDICKNAGISNGALYKYFKNKEALFLCLIDYGIELVNGLYQQFDTDKPVIPTLRAIFNGIKLIAKDMGFIISMYLDLGTCTLNNFAEKKSAELEKIGRDFLTELLSKAAARDEISRMVDIKSTVYLIDNLIILYSYSTVSVHHRNRLLAFMHEKKDVPEKKKIAFMLEAVNRILEANIK